MPDLQSPSLRELSPSSCYRLLDALLWGHAFFDRHELVDTQDLIGYIIGSADLFGEDRVLKRIHKGQACRILEVGIILQGSDHGQISQFLDKRQIVFVFHQEPNEIPS